MNRAAFAFQFQRGDAVGRHAHLLEPGDGGLLVVGADGAPARVDRRQVEVLRGT